MDSHATALEEESTLELRPKCENDSFPLIVDAPMSTGTRDVEQRVAELVRDSPFLDLQHPINLYELVKLILMIPIAITRFLTLATAVCFAWAVLVVMLTGSLHVEPLAPPWRARLVRAWVKGWASFLLVMCGYYRIPVKGWRHLAEARKNRAIIVFNHESYVDPALLAALFAPCGIAKAGVARIPFFSTFARALQFLFVERKGTCDQSNRYTLRVDPMTAVAERAQDPRYPLLMMAPEATTKGRPCLLKFRRGGFAAGLPVLPVLVRYPCNHFYPGWGLAWSTPFHMWRLLSQVVNYAEVTILPVYYPEPPELEEPAKYAANVRKLMARCLEVDRKDQGIVELHTLMRAGVKQNFLGTGVVGLAP